MSVLTREMILPMIPGSETIPQSTDLSGFDRRYMDLAYANASPSQKLNIVLPKEGDGPFPVVVYIHGGGFLTGDKNHVQTQSVNRLLFAGYAVCCINYRLSDEAKWPAQIYDCKAAIRFLRANAKKYNLNAERIGVVGNSAGGHFAALLGTTNNRPEYEDLSMGNAEYSSSVQAVFCWFGIYDFTHWVDDCKKAYPDREMNFDVSPEAYFFGCPLTGNPKCLAEASPRLLLDENTVPFYVEHGTGDHAVPYYQCKDFYDTYVEKLGPDHITMKLFDGEEHSGASFKTDENVFEFVRFFDRWILEQEPREYFRLGTLGAVDTVV